MLNNVRTATFCATLLFIFSILTLLAWALKSTDWLQFVEPGGHMMPASAVGFLIASLCLFLNLQDPTPPEKKYLSHFFALCLILIGGISIKQTFWGWNLDLDHLLNLIARPQDGVPVYRMSVYSSLNFIVSGIALLILESKSKTGRRPSQYLSLLTMIFPLHALLGYFYGIKSFQVVGAFSDLVQIAPMTSLCWLLLAVGTLCSRGQMGLMRIVTSPSPAGQFLRRVSLPAVLIPLLMGWFVATAENLRVQDLNLSASILTICCLIVFMVILWKNGAELYRVQNERDLALERLKNANHAAQEANRAKSSFLANMSHEIRNPVGVMMGFADLLADPKCAPQVRTYYADVLKRNGRTLLAILNDILDLSKVEANKLNVEFSSTDLTSLIRDLSLIHRPEAITKGVQFKVHWDEPVPRLVLTDPHRLRQILNNLLGNAIKFTERGSINLKIHAHKQEDQSAVISFDVIDTGPGIPDHLKEKLFHPFEQADVSYTRKFGGTGLGLALSKRLAKAILGDVSLKQSTPGKGATFSLTLNVKVPEVEATDSSAHNILPPTSERRLHGQKILVAEDSPDNRFLLEKLLRSEGANVIFAENGIQAVEKASQEDFDMILMDIQMPELDGLEASTQLRAKGFEKPIIALTAHAMKEDRLRSLAAGLNDHVTKPINREELIRAVQRWAFSGKESPIKQT